MCSVCCQAQKQLYPVSVFFSFALAYFVAIVTVDGILAAVWYDKFHRIYYLCVFAKPRFVAQSHSSNIKISFGLFTVKIVRFAPYFVASLRICRFLLIQIVCQQFLHFHRVGWVCDYDKTADRPYIVVCARNAKSFFSLINFRKIPKRSEEHWISDEIYIITTFFSITKKTQFFRWLPQFYILSMIGVVWYVTSVAFPIFTHFQFTWQFIRYDSSSFNENE